LASNKGKLVLLIGPSGVGKSVILKKLRAKHPELHFPKSATTRPRRAGEGDEIYHFVSDAEMDSLIADKKVLEWAVVHGGARYATLLDEIIPPIEEGKTVVRGVDVQGMDRIRLDTMFDPQHGAYRLRTIFILPESKEQLLAHIEKRAPMTKEELEKRMQSMEKELSYAAFCDEQIVNPEGKLEDTFGKIEQLILAA
jgi:guanylate kinase